MITSFYGACRLARLDPAGVDYFDRSVEGARRSFFAAALVAPLFVLVTILLPPTGAADGGFRWIGAEAIAYVTSWVAYPVLVEWLSRMVGCREKFEGYLSVYNWAMVLQNLVMLPLVAVTAFDVLPGDVLQLFWVVAIALVSVYLWFIARTALGVSATTAIGFVLLDELVSILIDTVAARIG